MWKTAFVVLGAAVGYVGPIVVGAALHYAMELAASWPGRSGPVGGHSEAADWIRWIGVPLGVLVFSLIGFWRGSRLDRRAGRDEAPQTWKAVLAVLGALVGYVMACFLCWFVQAATRLRVEPDTVIFFAILSAGGAAISLLGFRLGSMLDERTKRSHSPQKWKATMTALGAAVGPVIGFFAIYCLSLVSNRGDCMRGFGAFFTGLCHGAPIGGILFCLLGLCLGSALDERSRRDDLQIDNSNSA
jgi:hypothetical protein